MKKSNYVKRYLKQTVDIIEKLNYKTVDQFANSLWHLKEGKGRLFILGIGGSAGHASHAVNDFRKLCGIEAYTPTDNVSEFTARVNDDGWDSSFTEWLKASNYKPYKDIILVFSVGGGTSTASANIAHTVDYAKSYGGEVLGIIGKSGGSVYKYADHYILIPSLDKDSITAHTEGLTAVIWHCIVNHPLLRKS